MMFYYWLFSLYAFCFGAAVASFLNVCIWRIPREESVVRPPSHCPKCNAPIRWYQNIPILSWLALRGRCANCREPISPRYIGVETLGGVLFLLVFLQWATPFFVGGMPPLGLVGVRNVLMVPVGWYAVANLIFGSFVDYDHQWIPDRVTIGGMIAGVLFSVFVPEMHAFEIFFFSRGELTWRCSLMWSLAGMAFGFGTLWLLGEIFSRIFKKDAMGFGDVKLIGAVGAFFGPVAVLFTLFASAVVGSVVGVAMIWRGRARLGGFTAIPYGPYLAFGALLWLFWGPRIALWYLGLLMPAAAA